MKTLLALIAITILALSCNQNTNDSAPGAPEPTQPPTQRSDLIIPPPQHQPAPTAPADAAPTDAAPTAPASVTKTQPAAPAAPAQKAPAPGALAPKPLAPSRNIPTSTPRESPPQTTQAALAEQTTTNQPSAQATIQEADSLKRMVTQHFLPQTQQTGKSPPPSTNPPAPSANTFKDYPRSPVVQTEDDAVSTFALDTDRTSFQLALNWARSGYEIDPSSVRAEEWINAFDYNYDQPLELHNFAIHSDAIAHPLDDTSVLARIAFQAPHLSDHKPLNVTLVLDASGSMSEGNRIDIARTAARTIQRSMREGDRISVVHFTENVLDQYTVRDVPHNSEQAVNSIAQLQPHGSTNVQAGLDLGVRIADEKRDEYPDRHNYVILMSDGVANVDATNPFAILESAGDYTSDNPLRLITVGVGISNYNDYLLEQLAQHGNGWYRYLHSPEHAAATFSRDNWLALSTPFADQARAQITWNPEAVRSWRIVGYENRVTADENFEYDRKEFAEIPSGAATTVFYELKLSDDHATQSPVPSEPVHLGDVELRWLTPVTASARAQRARIESLITASPDNLLIFSAIVALSADRYSAITSDEKANYTEDLAHLSRQLHNLSDDLGHLASFNDFKLVMNKIRRDHRDYILMEGLGYSQ